MTKLKEIIILLKELYKSKHLIINLARNDFKTKYAGSYLGITWAFVQPIVTILLFWFVFQVAFKAAPISGAPYILWLICGLIPWFFYSEALLNGTNSMIEYSYLVKKVLFKISILPVIKIISSLFVHIFFICFIVLILYMYGYTANIYYIQVIYYSFCLFMVTLSLSFITSSIILFFRDLGQIMNIFLQITMWLTPIMWSYKIIPERYNVILKINPMYYIIEGYRDTFINKVWFFHRYNQTIYFWIIVLVLFIIGATMFKKLKPHFSDVL